MYEDKTQNNILDDMKLEVSPDVSTEEGTLIDHALRGASAEFEKAYVELELIAKNGFAQTADREHLILRAKERGIAPYPATYAVWKGVLNGTVEIGTRFSAGELTYIVSEKMQEKTYKLTCEQSGTVGNKKQDELIPIEFVEGFESGELKELLIPAQDDEETENFRRRYLENTTKTQAFSGNRAQYREIMHAIDGVGACKIYRITEGKKTISIYFLDNQYKVPSEALVADVQKTIDPVDAHGEGEGEAPIYHVVDIFPCGEAKIDIAARITLDAGYTWDTIKPAVQKEIDNYYTTLAKKWEDETYTTVRLLKINTAIVSVDGVVDVQETRLNGKNENVLLEPEVIPVRGNIVCL